MVDKNRQSEAQKAAIRKTVIIVAVFVVLVFGWTIIGRMMR